MLQIWQFEGLFNNLFKTAQIDLYLEFCFGECFWIRLAKAWLAEVFHFIWGKSIIILCYQSKVFIVGLKISWTIQQPDRAIIH